MLPLITFGMAYLIVDVPKPGDIRTNQVSTILASDGSELAKIVPPEGNRVDVNIDQIPVHVRDAVMAAEDRDFYSNPGFSFTGFARAFKNNLFGGDLQGGSTITQQYVKNALVGDARSGIGGLIRKAKELVISTKMSGEWSKDQVLQSYLNIIYFGRGAYGISAASKAYFDKPVEQLDVAEGALLAALIQRPSAWTPPSTPRARPSGGTGCSTAWSTSARCRQQDRAAQVFPPTVPPDQARSQDQTTGPNGLIERQVTKELLDLFDINEQTLNTEGLQITTTIDPKAQQAAEEAVSEDLDGQDPDMRSAVVSIDPHNRRRQGLLRRHRRQRVRLRAGRPADRVRRSRCSRWSPRCSRAWAWAIRWTARRSTVNGIKITNVEGGGCGTCNIAEALKRSLNTSYYRLMLKLKNGPQDVADAAHQAGIAESFPGVDHTLSEDGKGGPPNNGIVLGQYQTRVHRHGVGVRHARRVGRLPQTALRAEGGQRPGRGAVRRRPAGQLRRAAHRQGGRRQRHLRDAADRRLLQRPQPRGRTRRRRPRPAPTSSATPAPTGTPGWSASPRRCRRRCGWAPPRAPSRWRTSRARRCTARVCRRTSGRPRWTARSTAPTTSRSRSRRRSAAMPVCRRRRRPRRHRTAPPPPSETVIQPTLEIAPGITIPSGRRPPCPSVPRRPDPRRYRPERRPFRLRPRDPNRRRRRRAEPAPVPPPP